MHRLTSSYDPLQILLIEDNKGDALLIKKALDCAMFGAYQMAHATRLEQASYLLTTQRFDVALLDRSLPDVDSFSGLHHLQSMAPHLPIIFLTAYQDELTAFEAIEQGAQDYLVKGSLDGHTIARAVQYAVLRKQFEGVLILRANYDMLTGLANRMLFESRLDMAMAKMNRQGGNIGVLFLDLNRFKHVNDTFGHSMGDRLLKEVGDRLKKSLRPYDTAARLGGDEFAILLEGLPELQYCETVASKIIAQIDAPFQILGNTISVGVSIGIAICNASYPLTHELLLSHADEAMYIAKARGKSCFERYNARIPHGAEQSNKTRETKNFASI